MNELYAVCQQCGERMTLGDADKINVELDTGEEVRSSDVPEAMTGLREWLEVQPCPSCGASALRVEETDEV